MTKSRHATTAIAMALALAGALVLPGCGGDQPILNAVGSYSDVAVVCDLRVLEPAAQQLERELEEPVEYSLRPEPALRVDIFDVDDLRDAALYKNVIVLGLTVGRDAGREETQRRMGGEAMRQLDTGLYLATAEDIYAGNQNVLFLAGADRNLLQSALRRSAPALRGQIEEENRERIRDYLFSQGRKLAKEQQVAEAFGFRIAIPEDYELTRLLRGAQRGLVEVAATRPTRAAGIFYEVVEDASVLEDREQLLAIRRRWGSDFLEEQLQDAGGFRWTEVEFRGERLPMLAGFWDQEIRGGPFRTIFRYDEATGRLYGINWLCYAPRLDKHPFMREAHAVAETFVPRP